MEKKTHTLLSIFLSVIILLLTVFAFIMTYNYSNEIKSRSTNNNMTAGEKYSVFLTNIANNVKGNGFISVFGEGYTFTIDKDLNLLFTREGTSLKDLKIDINVVSMFLVNEKEGKTLYYIKSNGELDYISVASIQENIPALKIGTKKLTNIVSVLDGMNDNSYKTSFIDIDGNIKY